MAWEHLAINRPHLVYIILGGFTTLFMLCSSIIKERLYIGEATVATICGIIFGPHAANLINPQEWGNPDLITLEFSRIVLVVQCFAVGVELPKSYMERHWRSVTFLLIPVMTFGWLITSVFIWWMFGTHLDWLDSLTVAACVTATDPVLASSVVGKGKFAKRVPKHLRDLLSAESGCNDGMAFPFIYLSLYLIRYRPDANKVSFHFFAYTVLYECLFGAIYGVAIGYIARRAVRFAHERDLIDRESFLVFYFVLALFCAGSGSILGVDDLLVGFAAGVGFSNDGWFQEKTEESHVSNVIDLLINLAFFVYFGTIIPWEQYNQPDLLGITPWRLVVVAVFVLFFRRIPIMLALKPVIPDIKTWREALFAGHFGPIGVGAIFVAILARAELETEGTSPLAVLPEKDFPHLNIIELIWPITTFLVVISIVVHGSSIAVFTLGKHINTLTLTLSYTQAPDDGPSWMDRLPRIQSRSKTSMSGRRLDDTESSYSEKMDYPEGTLPPIGVPGNFLRRQKEEDTPNQPTSVRPSKRKSKKWDAGIGPGGPVSQSAIGPRPRLENTTDSDTLALNSDESPDETTSEKRRRGVEQEEEVYQEGDKQIIEDEEGNVLEVRDTAGESKSETQRKTAREMKRLMKEKDIEHGVAQTEHPDNEMGTPEKAAEAVTPATETAASTWGDMRKKIGVLSTLRKHEAGPSKPPPQKKHGPALAYQFGNTIIVEDEDGEVIKKYDIPSTPKAQRPRLAGDRKASFIDPEWTKNALTRMGTYMGLPAHHEEAEAGPSNPDGRRKKSQPTEEDDDDDNIRFTVTAGGRRMSKMEFIQQIQRLDPKSRAKVVEESDAPEALKQQARAGSLSHDGSSDDPAIHKVGSKEQRPSGPGGLTLVDSNNEDIPFHAVSDTLAHYSFGDGGRETAAQRRRRQATREDSGSDEPRARPGRTGVSALAGSSARERDDESPGAPATATGSRARQPTSYLEEGETAAERRRRLAALGNNGDSDSESSEDEGPGGLRDPNRPRQQREAEQRPAPSSVRFAPQTSPSAQTSPSPPAAAHVAGSAHHLRGSSGPRLRWGADVGQKPSESSGSNGGDGGKKK
jgi:NhaP-type Na+/H+ or K+/H+ antiporter